MIKAIASGDGERNAYGSCEYVMGSGIKLQRLSETRRAVQSHRPVLNRVLGAFEKRLIQRRDCLILLRFLFFDAFLNSTSSNIRDKYAPGARNPKTGNTFAKRT